jgi:hypothetical protein
MRWHGFFTQGLLQVGWWVVKAPSKNKGNRRKQSRQRQFF